MCKKIAENTDQHLIPPKAIQSLDFRHIKYRRGRSNINIISHFHKKNISFVGVQKYQIKQRSVPNSVPDEVGSFLLRNIEYKNANVNFLFYLIYPKSFLKLLLLIR